MLLILSNQALVFVLTGSVLGLKGVLVTVGAVRAGFISAVAAMELMELTLEWCDWMGSSLGGVLISLILLLLLLLLCTGLE